jgi:O-antigen/teichoic acid export membrane protein
MISGYRAATVFGVLSRGVVIFIRFASVPLLITLLSPERYGLWLILGSVIGWLGFSDLGIPSALQNRLIILLREGQVEAGRALVGFAFHFLATIAIAVFAIGILAALLLPWGSFFKLGSGEKADFVVALMLSIFSFALALPARLGSVLYTAHGRLAIPPLTDLIVQISGFGMLAVVVWQHWGTLTALSASSLIGLSLGPILLTILARRKFGYRLHCSAVAAGDRHVLMTKGAFFFITVLGELLVLQSDAFVIGMVLGAAAVPVFLIPNTFWMNFLQTQNIFLRPLWPMLTQAYADRDYFRLRGLVGRGLILSFSGAVLFAFALILFGNWFIGWWSKGVAFLPPIMAWGFGMYIIASSIDNILATYLNAFGLIEMRFGYTLLFGGVKVLLAIAILHFGSIQMLPWGFMAAMMFTSIPFASFALYRTLARLKTQSSMLISPSMP